MTPYLMMEGMSSTLTTCAVFFPLLGAGIPGEMAAILKQSAIRWIDGEQGAGYRQTGRTRLTAQATADGCEGDVKLGGVSRGL